MTRAEAIQKAAEVLRAANLAEPVQEARWLVGAVLECDALELVTGAQVALSAAEEVRFAEWLRRRAAHEPLGRIKGKREFWGLEIFLNEATMEPRPDTETLVEAVLAAFPDRAAPLRLLDIATGSGCILLALLSEYKNATGIGTDKSARAVEAAAANAARLGLADRVAFQVADWATGVAGPFDVIVSNPPYITSAHVEALEANVREYDPQLALDGGVDGLVGYKAVVPQAAGLLKTDGLLAVEVGFDQAAAVRALFGTAGLCDVVKRRDLGGVVRVVGGRKAA